MAPPPAILRLRNGATLLNLNNGTTTNGGTTRLKSVDYQKTTAQPFAPFTSSVFQGAPAEVMRTYPYPTSHTITVDWFGQDQAHLIAAHRDLVAVAERPGTVLEVGYDGATLSYFDCYRFVAPSLPLDLFVALLDRPFVQQLVLHIDSKPFARPSATSATNLAQTAHGGGSYAGVGVWSQAAAAGDVAPRTKWTWPKSAAADDVSFLWMVGCEAAANPHLVAYAPGTGGTGATWTTTAATTSTQNGDASSVSTAANSILRWTASGTTEEAIGYFQFSSHAPQPYHPFLIVKQNGGASGDITGRLRVTSLQNPAGQGIDITKPVAPKIVGAWCVLDLFSLIAPLATTQTYRIYVYATRSTGAATLDLDSLHLFARPTTINPAVNDFSGGDSRIDYAPALSTATFTGPITVDGTLDRPLATVTDASAVLQTMALKGSPPKAAAGPLANPLWVGVLCAASDTSFARTKGVGGVPTATYYPAYAGFVG